MAGQLGDGEGAVDTRGVVAIPPPLLEVSAPLVAPILESAILVAAILVAAILIAAVLVATVLIAALRVAAITVASVWIATTLIAVCRIAQHAILVPAHKKLEKIVKNEMKTCCQLI